MRRSVLTNCVYAQPRGTILHTDQARCDLRASGGTIWRDQITAPIRPPGGVSVSSQRIGQPHKLSDFPTQMFKFPHTNVQVSLHKCQDFPCANKCPKWFSYEYVHIFFYKCPDSFIEMFRNPYRWSLISFAKMPRVLSLLHNFQIPLKVLELTKNVSQFHTAT